MNIRSACDGANGRSEHKSNLSREWKTKLFHSSEQIFLIENKFSDLKRKSFLFSRSADGGIVTTNEFLVSLQDESEAAVDDGVDDSVSQLDLKSMKVAELRAELDARNLPSKGEKYFKFN